MGLRFSLDSAEAVAYLVGHRRSAPRLPEPALRGFLETLAGGPDPQVISGDASWVPYVAERAVRSLQVLDGVARQRREADPIDGHVDLDPDEVTDVLDPVRLAFARFELILLPVAAATDRDEVIRWAMAIAERRGPAILVLIPDTSAEEAVTVVEPGRGVREALRRRHEWPGVIVYLGAPPNSQSRPGGPPEARSQGQEQPGQRRDDARFLSVAVVDRALRHLAEVFGTRGLSSAYASHLLDSLVDEAAEVSTCRILHLSDLHFGKGHARRNRAYLELAIGKVGRLDHVVITGDLFDRPRPADREAFDSFLHGLVASDAPDPRLVLGNHDQRQFGNTIGWLGQKPTEVGKVHIEPVWHHDESNVVFLTFNSAERRNLARGEVSNEQLMAVATEFDAKNAKGRFDGFLRVALVHHHPYPYPARREQSILDPTSWPGREKLIGMKESERFLAWCASRGVSLILHGHRHIPRLINDVITDGVPAPQHIATVGCGTSTGANGGKLSFNIVEWSSQDRSWTVDFQVDPGNGAGFYSAAIQSLTGPMATSS